MFFIVIINFILQTTLFQYIAIVGVKPNTALLIIISYAILRGDIEGALVGFFAGFIQDIFFGQILGMFALFWAFTGYVCGKPFKDFFPENYLMPVALASICMLANELAFYSVDFLLTGKREIYFYFSKIILPETLYTTVLSLFVYRFIYGINHRLESYERKRNGLFFS